jgi:hypothetical protein
LADRHGGILTAFPGKLMKPRIEGRDRFYDWSVTATYGPS